MTLKNNTSARTKNEPIISEQASVILKHRYLLKNNNNEPIETPKELFMRVAKAISSIDTTYGKLSVDALLTEKDFYSMMASLEFIPNSPTLMNAGTEQGTLSACFVLPLLKY